MSGKLGKFTALQEMYKWNWFFLDSHTLPANESIPLHYLPKLAQQFLRKPLFLYIYHGQNVFF